MSSIIPVPRFGLESRCSHRRRVVVAVVAIVVRGGGDLGGAASLGKIPKSGPLKVRRLVGPRPKRPIRSTRRPDPLMLHTRSPPRHPKSILPNGFRAKPPRRRAKKKSLRTRKTRKNCPLSRRDQAMPPDDFFCPRGAPHPSEGSRALSSPPYALWRRRSPLLGLKKLKRRF
jgi:hypothetical protein